jgi:myo-inositol-1(or 4)-monophosphatase
VNALWEGTGLGPGRRRRYASATASLTAVDPEFLVLRDVAERAARRGAAIVRGLESRQTDDIAERPREKAAGDYVTEADVASERAIVELLARETPGVAVLGEEEGGATLADDALAWVIDPLDGTTNFVHRFPLVGVSVALVDGRRPLAGAIAAPFLDEGWIASSGSGAYSIRPGEEPVALRVSTRDPDHAVVGTGFPFRHKDVLPRYLRTMEAALERFEDLRRPGAASLDLAWVAAGVFDGFFELGLSPWDVAAGALLIQEAGGVVTDWSGGEDFLSGDIVAGSPAVHAELLDLAASAEIGFDP